VQGKERAPTLGPREPAVKEGTCSGRGLWWIFASAGFGSGGSAALEHL
jgi:hypothetical protein